jgi:hypothetical protein
MIETDMCEAYGIKIGLKGKLSLILGLAWSAYMIDRACKFILDNKRHSLNLTFVYIWMTCTV